MPAEVKLTLKELDELIAEIEAKGGDPSELKKLRAELPEEERPRQPARPRGVELRAELTTEERLNLETADLFPGGITADILAMCIEYDLKYSLGELRTMCAEAGLSPSGHKKLLAAKLLAHQWESEPKRKAGQPALFSF